MLHEHLPNNSSLSDVARMQLLIHTSLLYTIEVCSISTDQIKLIKKYEHGQEIFIFKIFFFDWGIDL